MQLFLCTEGYKEMMKKVSSSADPLLPVLRNSGLQSSGPLHLLPKDMLKFFMKQRERAWKEQSQRTAENTGTSESSLKLLFQRTSMDMSYQ